MRLEAAGKRHRIREPWVVRGGPADLPAGRLIGVAGRNGSGKSTLPRVVAGVSRPSAGKVTEGPRSCLATRRPPAAGRIAVIDLIGDPAVLPGLEVVLLRGR